ncbi:MAG: rhomboid family intramembrane serine protease [Chitinophagaceae bacterium]|nr:rhomboid family intramembrane serine protease [Chitinophagaceae bacterium]
MANKFSIQTSLDGLSEKQFLMLCSNAITTIGWQHHIDFEVGIEASTGANLKTYGETITIKIDNGIAEIKSVCTQWQITDWGKNKKNIQQLLGAIEAEKLEIDTTQLDEQIELLIAERIQAEKDFIERKELGELTPTEKIAIQQGANYITYILIAINVFIFIAMVVSGVSLFEPSAEAISNWGGNFRLYTVGGDWWRLLTCVFVHIGIIHLALNMYALFFIGSYLEPLLGKAKFALIYICTGVLASVVSIWWSGESVSAGASGAIFGMYGVFLALLTTKLIDQETRKALLQSILIFVGYNLLYGMKGGIDNAAHIGGLVSGFVLGYVLYYGIIEKTKSVLTSALIVLVTVLTSYGYLSTSKNDDITYLQKLEEIVVLEKQAIAPLNMQNITQQELTNMLTNTSLPNWQKSKSIISTTLSLNLSNEKLTKQRMHFRDYINLRIRETELLIISITDSSEQYKKEFAGIENSIEIVLDLLKNE